MEISDSTCADLCVCTLSFQPYWKHNTTRIDRGIYPTDQWHSKESAGGGEGDLLAFSGRTFQLLRALACCNHYENTAFSRESSFIDLCIFMRYKLLQCLEDATDPARYSVLPSYSVWGICSRRLLGLTGAGINLCPLHCEWGKGKKNSHWWPFIWLWLQASHERANCIKEACAFGKNLRIALADSRSWCSTVQD